MPIRNPNGRTWGPGSVQMEFRPGARVRSRRPEGHELPDCHLGVTPSMHLHSSILDQIHSLRIAVEFKSCKHVNMSKIERRQAREQVVRDLNGLTPAHNYYPPKGRGKFCARARARALPPCRQSRNPNYNLRNIARQVQSNACRDPQIPILKYSDGIWFTISREAKPHSGYKNELRANGMLNAVQNCSGTQLEQNMQHI